MFIRVLFIRVYSYVFYSYVFYLYVFVRVLFVRRELTRSHEQYSPENTKYTPDSTSAQGGHHQIRSRRQEIKGRVFNWVAHQNHPLWGRGLRRLYDPQKPRTEGKVHPAACLEGKLVNAHDSGEFVQVDIVEQTLSASVHHRL